MNKIYLIKETGREDSFTFIGKSDDLKKLIEDDQSVEIIYPGLKKDIWVTFKESENPESDVEVKKHSIKNKTKEWTGTIIFILIFLFTVFGAIQFLKMVISWLPKIG